MGTTFIALVAQCRGRRFKLGVSVSATLVTGTLSCPRSSVERAADYESVGRRCNSCRGHFFQMTLSSNRTGHSSFTRAMLGSNPAGVANFHAHVAQQQRHDVENVASAGATPAMSTLHGPKT